MFCLVLLVGADLWVLLVVGLVFGLVALLWCFWFVAGFVCYRRNFGF